MDPIEPTDGGVTGQLELREDDGGARHFLDGAPVHGGDVLEVLLGDGRWLAGSYELSGLNAFLVVPLGAPDGRPVEPAALRLPASAHLRREGA